MDLISKAEALEAIAADLRAEAARDQATGQLPLVERPWIAWHGDDSPPVRGNVEYELANGVTGESPAAALSWQHYQVPGIPTGIGPACIVRYRPTAEQPDT